MVHGASCGRTKAMLRNQFLTTLPLLGKTAPLSVFGVVIVFRNLFDK